MRIICFKNEQTLCSPPPLWLIGLTDEILLKQYFLVHSELIKTHHTHIVGIFIFAGDIFLLSANRSGLQYLVTLCEEFARSKNLSFGTNKDPKKSKTKCIVFSKGKFDCSRLAPVQLDGNNLPWVDELNHLGVTLQADNSMKIDVKRKRAKLISKIHSLSQGLHLATPETILKIILSHACSFHGSTVWDLESSECQRLYRSWNVLIRQTFGLDRKTRKYLIEGLSCEKHLKTMIYSRKHTFFKSLRNSPKFVIKFLAAKEQWLKEHSV